jgi:Flp pilus assembly protein TadD
MTITRTFLVTALVGFAASVAYPAGEGPVAVSPPAAGTAPNAQARYNEGVSLAQKGDWKGAEAAYRDATQLKSNFAEAWNGLGHSLKNLGRFDDSVSAYQTALRIRPQYPQALEYLGEAYVKMGRVDDARAVLQRLRPIDAVQAKTLERAIAGGTGGW